MRVKEFESSGPTIDCMSWVPSLNCLSCRVANQNPPIHWTARLLWLKSPAQKFRLNHKHAQDQSPLGGSNSFPAHPQDVLSGGDCPTPKTQIFAANHRFSKIHPVSWKFKLGEHWFSRTTANLHRKLWIGSPVPSGDWGQSPEVRPYNPCPIETDSRSISSHPNPNPHPFGRIWPL